MAGVTLTLLGGFSATVDGTPVPDGAWRLRKARDLVKLLALSPDHRLHREQAMDALWPDRTPDSAANNLYQAVHAARRALGQDAIGVREQLITLEADVDVARFEAAAEAARRTCTAAAYRAALDLAAGELLPENRYDDWAEIRREQLAELQVRLQAALGRFGTADRLMLPADPGSFVGRDRELGQLRSLLSRTRLLTLVGTGGAGKTRLALELARTVEAGYEDGAALVELAVVTNLDRAPEALAGALDIRALPGRTLLDACADYLADRTVLLVVDNCEHLLEPSAMLVDTILRAAPKVTVIATSREPLRAPGEAIFRVPSLAIPDPEHLPPLDDLRRYEAVRLFVERAEAASSGFALDETNAGDIARICLRLDGLPLALELAAGRTGALSPAMIAERLDDRFRLLADGNRTAPTRQQTLAATLDWSHDLLGAEEQELLRRLAVFAGSFDLDAVEAVCGESPETAHSFARLVEKSLVAVEGQDTARRFRLLETVRLYALHRLDEAGETSGYRRRHAAWALALAEHNRMSATLDANATNLDAALDTLFATEPEDALRLCLALWPFWLRRIELAEAERRFSAALAAAPRESELRARGLLAVSALDLRAGELVRGLERAEESLASLPADRPYDRWRALQFLGGYALTFAGQGEVASALAWFEQGLEIARQEGFAAEEALGVYSLGTAHWMGGLPGAEELLTESLDLFRALGAADGQIPSPINLAEIRLRHGSERPGLPIVLEETMQPFVDLSYGEATAYVLANLASLARSHGEFARSRVLLDESARSFERTGNDRGASHVLVRRAFLEAEEGRLDEARGHLEHAIAVRRRLNDRRGVGLALAGLGLVQTEAGELAAAEQALIESCAIFRRAGDRWGLVNALWRTADLALVRNDPAAAEDALQEARLVLAEGRIDRWVAHTITGLAEVALLRGEVERARELFVEAGARYASAADTRGAEAVGARLAAL
jgi:predicted ATPase